MIRDETIRIMRREAEEYLRTHYDETLIEKYVRMLETAGEEVEETYYSKGTHCGVFVQINMDKTQTRLLEELKDVGVKVTPLREALTTLPELVKQHYWQLVDFRENFYTALTAAYGNDTGYFIYVPSGVKLTLPLIACLLITRSNHAQLLHNIVVVESGAELCLLSGCLTVPKAANIAHVSVTEVYLGEGAKLSLAMFHNWNSTAEVRSVTAVKLSPGAKFYTLYFTHTPVKIVDMCTRLRLDADSEVYTTSIVVGQSTGRYYYRTEAVLEGASSRAYITSRVIASGSSEVVMHSRLEAYGSSTRGHIECVGLPLSNTARIVTIPELVARREDVQLSHEAAIGKLSEEELTYLMSRGLTEDEAKTMLITGFLRVEVPGLPDRIKQMIDKVVQELARRGAL